jgi:hypothetical protein
MLLDKLEFLVLNRLQLVLIVLRTLIQRGGLLLQGGHLQCGLLIGECNLFR